MEWFHHIQPAIPESEIFRLCTLENLPLLCGDVYEITRPGEISCVWGLFTTRAEALKNGVRYALTSCPNALQWTVTTRNGETVIHCTINHAAPDPDFAESIQAFMDKFHDGLSLMQARA